MEFAQLFTGLLLAVGAIHLVFSAVDAVGQWLLKKYRSLGIATKVKKPVSRSSWYVFFRPDVLCGKHSPTGRKQQPRPGNMTRNQQTRPRMTA